VGADDGQATGSLNPVERSFFLYKRKTDTTKGNLKRKASKQTGEREKKGV
jgi:hypothetical protein